MVWRIEDPQGDETGKTRWRLVKYTRGRGLDIGCGPSKAFPHFIGVDSRKDTELFGIQMKPDVEADACDLSMFASSYQDFVYSSHTLEHIEDHVRALREWWRVIKVGGYLILYLPHKDFYPNIGSPGSNPDHKHDFVPDDIIKAMKEVEHQGFNLLENIECNEDREYSFFQVYQKTGTPGYRHQWKMQKPNKRVAIIRYGAFGDMIQTSSITAAYKRDGWHVTLHSQTRGYEIAKSDPWVDEHVVVDRDQVPNAWCGQYWDWLNTQYDRVVNLCETVEGSLLAMPDRMPSRWPKEVRHAIMNKNYLEFMHTVALTEYAPNKEFARFYPTKEEEEWAKQQYDRLGRRVVMYVLTGSSVHKAWPHMDVIIARLLITNPEIHIVLVGDAQASILTGAWSKEPRVHCAEGQMPIRQTMALARMCDLVIGPETGVVNSVAWEQLPKVVILSHSTHENLTRDWVNTYSLWSPKTPCYPCHKMIYGFDQCNRDPEFGTAQCQTDVHYDLVWQAIVDAMKDHKFIKLDEKKLEIPESEKFICDIYGKPISSGIRPS